MMHRPPFAAALGILATLSVAACVAPPPYYAAGYPPPRYVVPPPPPPLPPYYLAQNGGPISAPTSPPPPSAAAPGVAPPPGQAPRETLRDRFLAANTTHDGCLTLAQAQVAGIRPVVRNFPQIDTAHRGCVTLPQIRAFNQAQRAARAQSAPPPPAP